MSHRISHQVETQVSPQETCNWNFSRVVQALCRNREVALGGRKGFGSSALKVNGRIFAMMSSKGKFVVKLPKSRTDALIASGVGERFEPRPGRPVKEWVVLADDGVNWVEIAKEACEFVRGSNPQIKC